MRKLTFSILMLIGLTATCANAQSGSDSSRRRDGATRAAMIKVETTDLPDALSATLKKEYDGWTVSAASRNAESTRYRVELTKSGETKTQWFDKEGKPLMRRKPS